MHAIRNLHKGVDEDVNMNDISKTHRVNDFNMRMKIY